MNVSVGPVSFAVGLFWKSIYPNLNFLSLNEDRCYIIVLTKTLIYNWQKFEQSSLSSILCFSYFLVCHRYHYTYPSREETRFSHSIININFLCLKTGFTKRIPEFVQSFLFNHINQFADFLTLHLKYFVGRTKYILIVELINVRNNLQYSKPIRWCKMITPIKVTMNHIEIINGKRINEKKKNISIT